MSKKEEIGQRIKALRQSRGIKQVELARAIGKAPSTITMYETGKREPEMETLEAIAHVFNVPFRELIADDDMSAVDRDRLEALHQNPRLGVLFDRSRKMSSEDVDLMIQLAKKIIRERDNNE